MDHEAQPELSEAEMRAVARWELKQAVIGVVASLMNPANKPAFAADNRAKQDRQRTEFADRRNKRRLLPIAEARKRRLDDDGETHRDRPRPPAEPVGAAHRLGAHLEVPAQKFV